MVGRTGADRDGPAENDARRSLQDDARMLRIGFEGAAVGMALVSLDGMFIETNRKFCEVFGYTQDELRRMSFRDINHPDERAPTEEHVRRLIAGEISEYAVEKRYLRKNGEIFWALATVTLIRDVSGAPLRFVGVLEDISRRRAAEEALRRSEEFARTVIESSQDCIKTLSLDGRVLWISDSGCRVLGVSDAAEVVGKSWVDYWSGEDRTAALQALAAAERGATGNFVGNLALGGEVRSFDVVITPLRDTTEGAPTALLAVSRDVSERMRVQQALREEARLLELLNETGAAIASELDVQTLLQKVTDVARELSGAEFGAFFYNATDESGDVYQLFTLSGAPREAFESFGHPRATPLFGPTFRGEAPIRCDDVRQDPRFGQWGPHHGPPPGHLPVRSYLAVPVTTRRGEVLGGLFFGHSRTGVFTERIERIISAIAPQVAVAVDNARLYEAARNAAEERKHLLESERFARAEAERVSATKDEFLAVVSHELRTPLNAILGWSHMMRAKVTDDETRKCLEIIERNARAQTRLIDDLLDMSRIASGKMRLDVQQLTPSIFVEAALETVRPAAAAKHIQLEARLDATAGPIHGDPNRLQQVVWNLLSNAIKFTPKGGRVEVELVRADSYVSISVADTGPGISPEFLDLVFERFRQVDPSTTRRAGGLGLGLAIVRRLVELHGGSVHVQSPGVGRGSTFVVKLPLAVAQRQDAEPSARPEASSPASETSFCAMDLRGIRAVVVDDQPDARELVARVLADCGASVVTAASALEGLALLEQHRPDVLVSDIDMPEVDGFELIRRVRALGETRGGKTPAIALTAFTRSEDRARALSAGFSVHISKPIEPSELVAAVAGSLGRTGPQP